MNLLFYSSPYKYYMENLIPLIEHAEQRGHKVYKRFSMMEEKDIRNISPYNEDETIYDLLSQRKIDAVVLVQPWWYLDKEIAGACNKYKIPFYIVDHAPPMMAYTEDNGKKSHLYRGNLFGSRAFFAYGNATKQIMRKRGCKENIVITGSPRIERMLENYNSLNQDKDFKAFVLYDTSHRMEDKTLIREVNKLKDELGSDWQFFVRRHSRSPNAFGKIPGVGSLEGPEEQALYFADMVGFTFPSSAMLLPALVGKDMIALYGKHFCKEAITYYRKYHESIPYRIGNKKVDYRGFVADNYYLKGSPKNTIIKYIEKNT